MYGPYICRSNTPRASKRFTPQLEAIISSGIVEDKKVKAGKNAWEYMDAVFSRIYIVYVFSVIYYVVLRYM